MLFSLDKQAHGVQLADFVTNLGVRWGNLGKGRAWLGRKVGLWVVWGAQVVMFWVQKGDTAGVFLVVRGLSRVA